MFYMYNIIRICAYKNTSMFKYIQELVKELKGSIFVEIVNGF